MKARGTTVAILFLASIVGRASAQEDVLEGADLYRTISATLPLDLDADFFGPGSDPFTGIVQLVSDPLPGFDGDVDTVIERGSTVPLASCSSPAPAFVQIELLALSLVSKSAIEVTFNGRATMNKYTVRECISTNEQPPNSSLCITSDRVSGGTVEVVLRHVPRIVFTRVEGSEGDATVTCTMPQIDMTGTGFWSYGNPFCASSNFGGSVDDCDPFTSPKQFDPSSNFFPAIEWVGETCSAQGSPRITPLDLSSGNHVHRLAFAENGHVFGPSEGIGVVALQDPVPSASTPKQASWAVSPRAALGGDRPREGMVRSLERITFDVGTGRVRRLGRGLHGVEGFDQVSAPEARATANVFKSTNPMGFFSKGNTDTEWRDWAQKDDVTGIVTQIYFAYATSATDPSLPGGPGAALEIAFYTGETGFCTGTGVEVADSRFCFTGLPGATGSLAPGTGAGYLVTAFLPSAFCLPEGKVGWSYGFVDMGTDSGTALTGPLTTSYVTENTTAVDHFDLFNTRPSATGTCLGTFFFGGCEPIPQVDKPCATFYIGVGEDDGSDLASSTNWNPTGCNENDYISLIDPVIGDVWSVGVDNTDNSGVGGDPNHDRVGVVLSLVVDAMNGNKCFGGGFKGLFNGTALYARPTYLPGATAQSFFLEGSGMSPAPADLRAFSAAVGKGLDLVGARFCTMGYSLDFPSPLANRFLSNALVIEVGTSR